MDIVPFTAGHVRDAARLVLDHYLAERRAVGILPLHGHYEGLFAGALEAMAGAPGVAGFAAAEGGELLGFLVGYPVDTFFSSHRGVYVPVYGHGARGGDRRLIYSRLYEAASEAWVGEGRLAHAVTMFAHDRGAVDAWFRLCFGLRCVDAIRPLAPVAGVKASGLRVRKAAPGDAEALHPLHAAHCLYYRRAPLFMPAVALEDTLPVFRDWLAGEGNHLWAAWEGGTPVSYMRICRGGETFVSDDPDMFNICGAYTAEHARGRGAGALLLSAIVDWMRERGCARLGVDYESFNVSGSRFWEKHFEAFTYSLTRCVDDRILS